MKNKVISIIMVIMFVLSTVVPVYAIESDYDNHWCQATIEEWLNDEFINGYTDGVFKPNNEITRAEFVKIINTVFGYEKEEGIFSVSTMGFDDVKAGQWYYDEVAKAINGGYINGVSKYKFAPNDKITREEAAVILARVKNLESFPNAINTFSDLDNISDWAKGLVGACIKEEYLEGSDNKINPKGKLTRAEAVAMIDRAMSLTIYDSGTVVENQRFQDIVIYESVGLGEVTLKNTVVAGEVIVEGGGENSVIFDSSTINTVKVNKRDNKIRLLIMGNTTIDNIYAQSGLIVEQDDMTKQLIDSLEISSSNNDVCPIKIKANIKNVIINRISEINIERGNIETMSVKKDAENTEIVLSKQAVISNAIINIASKFLGDGVIKNATINGNDVSFEIRPINISVAKGIKNPEMPSAPVSSGGGSSGGSSGTGIPSNEITKIIINPKNVKAVRNERIQFTLVFEGSGNYSKDVRFEIDSTENALISNSGLLEINSDALIGGKIEVKVISNSNSNVYDIAIVEITEEIEKPEEPFNENIERVEIDGLKKLKLFRNQSEVIKAKIIGKDGKNVDQKITWEVEDKNSATIIIDDYSKEKAVCVSHKAEEGSIFRVKAIATENKEKFNFIEVEVLRDNQIANFELYFGDRYDGDVFIGEIDEDTKQIQVKVPEGLNISNLNAEIYISELSTVEPGTPDYRSYEYIGDFTKPVAFTVTDAKGGECKYTVNVEIDKSLRLDPEDEDVVIKSFSNLSNDISYQEYAYGTEEGLLNLPDTIEGNTCLGNKVDVNVIKWKCGVNFNNKPEKDTEYIFSPIISKDIKVKNEVDLPTITVMVGEEGSDIVKESEKVDRIKITSAPTVNLYRGEFAVIEAEVVGIDNYNPSQKIVWSIESDSKAEISNYKNYLEKIDKIITVNEDAEEGKDIIVKATSAANPEKFAYITVKVYYDNQISSFGLKVKGTYDIFEGEINEENKTIVVNKPENIGFDELEAEFDVKTDCTISPGERTYYYSKTCIDNKSDFSKPVIYNITNAKGETAQYTLTTIESSNPDIPDDEESIKFGYFSKVLYRGEQRTIDASVDGEESQEIIWSIEEGGMAEIVDTTDIYDNPVKAVKINDDATEGSEIILRATSVANPVKSATTSIKVRYDNEIQYFDITDREDTDFDNSIYCSVDNIDNKIDIELFESYDLSNLQTKITVKSDSTVEPGNKKDDGEFRDDKSDFSFPVKYTVTDTNNREREYTVSIKKVPDVLILGFEELNTTSIEVENGTSENSVGYKLPFSVYYKIEEDDEFYSETFSAKWECTEEYNPYPTEDTVFTFKLILPKGYKLADGINLPEVKVTVNGGTGIDPENPIDPNAEIESVNVGESVYRYNRNGDYNPYFPKIEVKGKDSAVVSQEVILSVTTGSAIKVGVEYDYSEGKDKPAILVPDDALVGSRTTVKATSAVDETKYTTFDVIVIADNQIQSFEIEAYIAVDYSYVKYQGIINENDKTIIVEVDSNVDITDLDVKIYLHGDTTVNDKSSYGKYTDYSADFTNPVKYIIKSENGEAREYTVKVIVTEG